jgi:hypothetical protein
MVLDLPIDVTINSFLSRWQYIYIYVILPIYDEMRISMEAYIKNAYIIETEKNVIRSLRIIDMSLCWIGSVVVITRNLF